LDEHRRHDSDGIRLEIDAPGLSAQSDPQGGGGEYEGKDGHDQHQRNALAVDLPSIVVFGHLALLSRRRTNEA
jgi:hypothetical protein